MLTSFSIILSNPLLLGGIILCALLGGGSLLTAIHLCGVKGIVASSTKYVLAIVSVESIANFFMIVLNPQEFLNIYTSSHSLMMVLGLIAGWVIVYEANWIIKHQRVRNVISKCSNNKYCSGPVTK